MRQIYVILHYLLVTAYLVAPVVAVALALRRRAMSPSAAGLEPAGDAEPLAALAPPPVGVAAGRPTGLAGTFVAGTVMGVALSVVYAVAVKGTVSIAQTVLAAYFATALLLLLRAFDAGLRALVWRLSVRRGVGADGRPVRQVRRFAAAAGNTVRIAILFGFGLPFVMAAIVSYRPKVLPNDDPATQLGFDFEPVQFRATDGVRIAGWWLPAAQPGGGRAGRAGRGERTVIVCHGLGANKSNQLILARQLVPAGYNVLAIDLRAHGESGGQLTSFGDAERHDVLGAVRWIVENRPASAGRIFGVGASQGGAALIAAAASGTPEGDRIDAIAVYGSYDDLNGLVGTLAHRTFLPPLDWLIERMALPIAAAHVGADLPRFRPGELAMNLWPRPILVIHGVHDQIIDFTHGRRLFDSATQPKEHLWIERGDHNSIVNSEAAAEAVRLFLDSAEPVQVI